MFTTPASCRRATIPATFDLHVNSCSIFGTLYMVKGPFSLEHRRMQFYPINGLRVKPCRARAISKSLCARPIICQNRVRLDRTEEEQIQQDKSAAYSATANASVLYDSTEGHYCLFSLSFLMKCPIGQSVSTWCSTYSQTPCVLTVFLSTKLSAIGSLKNLRCT